MEITIVENLQREDLNPMDQARAFERLSTEFHMTQEQIATRTGKERVSVANFLRLLKLPASMQAQVESGDADFRPRPRAAGAETPSRISKKSQGKYVCTFAFCSPDRESMVQNLLNPERTAKAPKPEPVVDPNVREVKERLQQALGLKVTIEDHNGRGRVIIEYAQAGRIRRAPGTTGWKVKSNSRFSVVSGERFVPHRDFGPGAIKPGGDGLFLSESASLRDQQVSESA